MEPSLAPVAVEPLDHIQDVTVSIVVPSLNEELTIGEFVDWCHAGLQQAGVRGEILIVDSSTDRTAEIAEAKGARVVRVPKRGLGRAYIDAVPHIRGKYVIMGDCDLTYDFRELKQFVDALDAGNEFVMGTRMKGYIEPDAMPPLHRYFGTPLTTWILNRMYGTQYSDIHCGMRAMSLDALKRINIQSQSWEYASEMVLKAAKLRMKLAEVPIRFYKDRPGRLSHMKRSGWLQPWHAGWINLRTMFLHAPDFFLYKPGALMLLVGVLLTCAVVRGPVQIGPIGLSSHSMLLGITLSAIGFLAFFLGLLARVYHNFDPHYTKRVMRTWSYNRGMALAGMLVAAGIVVDSRLVLDWVRGGLHLGGFSFFGVFGLWFLILGFEAFAFTLILHMVGTTDRGRRD
jgi:glycosyltransferase involved in cell wall biosynthesis